jgi:hypothetical protein
MITSVTLTIQLIPVDFEAIFLKCLVNKTPMSMQQLLSIDKGFRMTPQTP